MRVRPSTAAGQRAIARGPVLDPDDPMPSARIVVEQMHTVDRLNALRHQAGVFYRYQPGVGAYVELPEATMTASLYTFLEGCRVVCEKENNRFYEDFQPTQKKVGEVLAALRAVCYSMTAPPCWLQDDPGCDPCDIIAFADGLLHIPTRIVFPPTPAFFTVTALDFAHDEHAPVPTRFLKFLRELWSADQESINTLGEIFGYLLTPRTHQQKVFMLIGPKRSGKGTIGRVLRRLLGVRNVAAPTLASLALPFGLQNLIDKSAALIADARISGRTDSAVIAERLLSISGEDPQSVGRKYQPDWNGILPVRFVVMTNELPTIHDASGALASRFILLRLTESFYGKEDPGLLDKLIPELPGILNWALDGYDRLSARGHFVQPKSSLELLQQLDDLGSPIGAFIRERCELGPAYQANQGLTYTAWQTWCNTNGREHPGTIQTLGKNLAAAIPGLKVTHPRICGNPVRHWAGFRVKDGRHSLVKQKD